MDTLSSRYRRLAYGWKLMTIGFPAIALILVLLSTFHWRPFGFVVIESGFLSLLLAAFLPLPFLWIPATGKSPKDRVPWYDVLLVVLSAGIPLYIYSQQINIMMEGWVFRAPTTPVALGIVLWLVVLEAGRRVGGPYFAALVTILSFYPYFGRYLPGVLTPPVLPFKTIVSYHIYGEESLFGFVIRMFGRLFFGYMLFAVVFQMLGTGKFFTELASGLLKKTRAGNAKVAIVASALFGTISGASIANIFVTGSFTIPAMKREGMPPHFAAAVEACAGEGGMLMPPVMAAVAFIMAEFLEVSYAVVAIAAVVPAVLYYVCLFAQIDAYAARVGMKPLPRVESIPVGRTLIKNLHLILSFVSLVVLIFILRLVNQGPWIASGVAIILAAFRKETRVDLRNLLVNVWEELGRTLGYLVGILAPVGMTVGGFILSGLAFALPDAIVSMAGGNIYLMLVFGAVASFILGMGVPTSACYIFLAIVLAPGLVKGGLDLVGVHLFIFYWGTLADITPPVALAAFAAASIAGSDPMKTGYKAMTLGIAKYILPFIFVLQPALILRAPLQEILITVPAAFVGIIIISGALEGYFWRLGRLTIIARVLLFAAGLLVIIPEWRTTVLGAGIVVLIFGLVYIPRGGSPLARLFIENNINNATGDHYEKPTNTG